MLYDVIVIGGGPGGYVAALSAAANNLKTALVEKEDLGGTCLNRGCIPTKALIHCADVFREALEASKFGIVCQEPSYDWSKVQAYKDGVVKKLRSGVGSLLKARKVDVYQGTACITGHTNVRIEGNKGTEKIEGKHIIAACGSSVARPPIPGIDMPQILTSDSILQLTKVPSSMIVVGGGIIGLELSYVMAQFGCKITIVEMLPELLGAWDTDLRAEVIATMRKLGIEIITGARVLRFEDAPSKMIKTVFSVNDSTREIVSENVLMAAGRRAVKVPCEGIVLKEEKGMPIVDAQMKTSYPSIYAIGDCIGAPMLAHAASHEGLIAVQDILGNKKEFDKEKVPSCLYMSPEFASVGLTEKQALERFGKDGYKVGKFPFSASGRAMAAGETRGFVKIIADAKWKEILGAHIAGPNATELIATVSAYMASEATVDQLIDTVFAHPTLSEAIMEAGFALEGKPIHII